jgi:hypothetical protein
MTTHDDFSLGMVNTSHRWERSSAYKGGITPFRNAGMTRELVFYFHTAPLLHPGQGWEGGITSKQSEYKVNFCFGVCAYFIRLFRIVTSPFRLIILGHFPHRLGRRWFMTGRDLPRWEERTVVIFWFLFQYLVNCTTPSPFLPYLFRVLYTRCNCTAQAERQAQPAKALGQT